MAHGESFAPPHKGLIDPSQMLATNGDVRHHWPGDLVAIRSAILLESGMIFSLPGVVSPTPSRVL